MKTCLLTLLLVLVGCKIAQAQTMQLDKQEAAIAAIFRLGGTLERDEQSPGKPVIKVDLHQTQVTGADLVHLSSLSELRHLDLRLTKIGDAGVVQLRQLTKLRFLNLFRTYSGFAMCVQVKRRHMVQQAASLLWAWPLTP